MSFKVGDYVYCITKTSKFYGKVSHVRPNVDNWAYPYMVDWITPVGRSFYEGEERNRKNSPVKEEWMRPMKAAEVAKLRKEVAKLRKNGIL